MQGGLENRQGGRSEAGSVLLQQTLMGRRLQQDVVKEPQPE